MKTIVLGVFAFAVAVAMGAAAGLVFNDLFGRLPL